MNDWEQVGMSETWDFKKLGRGTEIIGTYTRKKENIGKNASNLYTLKTEKGLVDVWGSTVLDNKFLDIAIGEEVKIIYKGQDKNPKSGRTYHNFEVWYKPAPFEKVSEQEVDLDEVMKELED